MAKINLIALLPIGTLCSVLTLGLFPLTYASADQDSRRSSSIGYQLSDGQHLAREALSYPSRYSHYPYSGLSSHYGAGHNSGISLGWSIGSSHYYPNPWRYRLGQTWSQDPWGYGDRGYSRWPYGMTMTPRYWRHRYYSPKIRHYPDEYQTLPEPYVYGYNPRENTGYGSEDNTQHSLNEQVPTIVNQVTSQGSTRTSHSSSLQSLPDNAKVIQLEHGTVYEWQGVRYKFDWTTQTYQKLVAEGQAKQE